MRLAERRGCLTGAMSVVQEQALQVLILADARREVDSRRQEYHMAMLASDFDRFAPLVFSDLATGDSGLPEAADYDLEEPEGLSASEVERIMSSMGAVGTHGEVTATDLESLPEGFDGD